MLGKKFDLIFLDPPFEEDLVSKSLDLISKYDLLKVGGQIYVCLLYTSPSPRDVEESRMPSSA